MNINLIGTNFDKNSGQGVYRYSGELLNELRKTNNLISINLEGDVNHVQQPELIWKALFKKNIITTVHDVIPLVYGERKFLFRIFFYLCMLTTCFKSKKIICDSYCTKRDLLRFFPFVKNKISVIYLGYDSKKFYPIKKKRNKTFTIGYVGGLGKRKNVKMILKVAKELENQNILFKIAGKGPELKNLLKLKKKLNIKNTEFVGFIPEDNMNSFYNSLDIFLFPSWYEGFGLPVLEAMATGTLIICSDNSSLPEITGKSAILIDPGNVEKIKHAIEKARENKKLQEEMKKKNLSQAPKFSWKKTTREYLKVIKNIK